MERAAVIVARHTFPADGEYEFRMNVGGGVGMHIEDLDISIDGEQVALLHYDKGIARNGLSADAPAGADYVRSAPIKVKAGQRMVSVAFVRRNEGPYEDLIKSARLVARIGRHGVLPARRSRRRSWTC